MKTKNLVQKSFSIAILLILLSNCTWVGTRKQINSFNKDSSVSTKDSFYLIYPKNGFQKTLITQELEANSESAEELVKAFRTSMSERFGQLSISDKNIGLEEAFKQANLKGNRYVIDFEINQWKDASYFMCAPSTNRQGFMNDAPTLDTADVTIFVYDAGTKKLLNKQRLENRGCPIVLFGLIPIGQNSPSSRFSSMLPEWLKNIQ